ncbi:MAG: DUF3786 domain-containing protein [Treponema sp.]|nr:DUF3786 domain-containing protein [Treponema sp.]
MNIMQNRAEANSHKNRSLNWFQDIYCKLDPNEIAARCNLEFDGQSFSIRIMNKNYRAAFPEFSLKSADPNDAEIRNGYEKILFIRFLCEGRFTPALGRQLSYHEIPWGETYYSNFDGRCIKRLAARFGSSVDVFRGIMEEKLNAEKLNKSDAGYRFEFCSGLYMSFLLWAADDEFPASAQILFDDNFPRAFTAEDIAVAGEVALGHLM